MVEHQLNTRQSWACLHLRGHETS